MIKLKCISLLFLLAVFLPAFGFAQTTRHSPSQSPRENAGVTLTALNYNQFQKKWLIELAGGTEKIKTHPFLLKNPNRLVVDIANAHSFLNHLSASSLANTPVKAIRNSPQPNNALRIVFDLNRSIPAQLFVVSIGSKKKPPVPINLAVKQRPSEIIVVIDPGHGGKDPGATGFKRIQEKKIVLNIAKKLQFLIDQQPGFKAILTRDGDYYLTLRERLAIARKNKADMFIAIHADAYPDPLAHGVSVFALSQRGATSEAARWLAARENQSELMGGVDLTDKEDMLRSVLINLSQTATIQASLTIGQNLLDQVHPFAHLHHDHLEQAAFVVLKSPDIPSLLVETGFVSNIHEENKLNSSGYQYNLAHAIMLGIKQYFIRRPPPGTWLASRDIRFKNG